MFKSVIYNVTSDTRSTVTFNSTTDAIHWLYKVLEYLNALGITPKYIEPNYIEYYSNSFLYRIKLILS